jgi:K+ transporter
MLSHQLSQQVQENKELIDKLKQIEVAKEEAEEGRRLMEAELEGVRDAFYKLKVGEGIVESKAVMLELEMLRREREDVQELKEKFMNARKAIFNWDDVSINSYQ